METSVQTETGVSYRVLPPEEWEKLRPVFDFYRQPLPGVELATAAVAESPEGELLGMLVLQLVLHAEPLWIRPDQRGKVSWTRMLHILEGLLKGKGRGSYYCFAPDEQIAGLARAAGLKELPYRVFQKEVE